MKILFDQNISFRLVKKISDLFPEAKQVRELGLENFSDKQIWAFAKESNFAIVTFDSDFIDLATLYGTPPKIIYLKVGNCSTDKLATIILNNSQVIKEFLEETSDFSLLEIIL